MKRPHKTSSDWIWLSVVTAPVAGLLTFLTVAAFTWQSRAATIKPRLQEYFPAEWIDAKSPQAAAYDAKRSTDSTERLRELGYAASAIQAKYSWLFDVLSEQTDWYLDSDLDPRIPERVEDYLSESQALLEALQGDPLESQTVWLPVEYGNPVFVNQELTNYGSLSQIIVTAMESAVRAEDCDRFLSLAKLFKRWRMTPNPELLSGALAVPMWNETQLNELKRMTLDFGNDATAMENRKRDLILNQIRWLLGRNPVDRYSPDPFKFIYAPSNRLGWLDRLEASHRVLANGPGTLAAVRKLDRREREIVWGSNREIDVALQFPIYGQTKSVGSTSSYALTLVREANELRFLRTAIALREYELIHGQFPEKLDALNDVGLPSESAEDPLGESFPYESTPDGYQLTNSSVAFQTGNVYGENFYDYQLISRGVGKYRQLIFR